MDKKVVLAYSGGLDTSVILKWLVEKGYKVVCFCGNVGQKVDLEKVKEKAQNTGAENIYIEDLRKEFVTDFIFPSIKANGLYEDRYLLGTALARPLLAKKQIDIAKKENAEYVAHGATGKGNDQVRFELSCYALDPNIKIISPWKNSEFLEKFEGRTDLLNYAKKHNIPVDASKDKPYSEDENLMHISHEAGILEDPMHRPKESVFSMTKPPKEAPNKETMIEVEFKKGVPVSVKNRENGTKKTDPLGIFTYLNELGKNNGIGREDMVENRFIGIKSRGVYENPGAKILLKAHTDLEGLTMDKEVKHLKSRFSQKFSELVYNGFWFSPEMEILRSALDKTQENVNGKVILSLYKGNVTPMGRESPTSLYDQSLSSMDVSGGFDQKDSRGFINIHSVRLKLNKLRKDKESEK